MNLLKWSAIAMFGFMFSIAAHAGRSAGVLEIDMGCLDSKNPNANNRYIDLSHGDSAVVTFRVCDNPFAYLANYHLDISAMKSSGFSVTDPSGQVFQAVQFVQKGDQSKYLDIFRVAILHESLGEYKVVFPAQKGASNSILFNATMD